MWPSAPVKPGYTPQVNKSPFVSAVRCTPNCEVCAVAPQGVVPVELVDAVLMVMKESNRFPSSRRRVWPGPSEPQLSSFQKVVVEFTESGEFGVANTEVRR